METQEKKRKRRPFYLLINKEFQVKFTAYFSLLTLFIILFLWSTIYLVFEANVFRAHAEGYVNDILLNIGGAIHYFFFWEGLMVIGLSIFLALLVSREIIGPLYRIENDLKSYNENPDSIKEIRLRKGDFFQGLVKELNVMLEKNRQ